MKIVNPATQKAIQEVQEDDAATIAAKFKDARQAQKAWASAPLDERKSSIARFRELLISESPRLSEVLSSEVGKPITQSRNELKGTLGRIDFFMESVDSVLKERIVHKEPGLEERISFEPLGVIANLSAWNYPYFVGSNVFLPALLAGNAVLYKPSEFSTLTGLAIADLLHQAGVPKEVFVPVVGAGSVGAALLEQPINGVFFTGSYRTGKRVAEAVVGRMIKVQLELGGKDPTYVCEDVEVKTAAEGLADGAFYNAGQSCCSVERIYVHEKIHDAFVKAFVETARSLVLGDPMDEATTLGPLTRYEQIAVLEAQVRDAQAKGAKLLCGGKRAGSLGNYFEPTVLIDVDHSMELMREESFGPVIGIQKVRDDADALRLMNETEYGLTAGVYTRDRARAEKLMRELNAGSVYWNCCDRVSPRLPWTGRGHSGMGSTLSTIGIETFVQPKAWHLRG